MGRRSGAVVFALMAAICAVAGPVCAQVLSGPTQLDRCDEGLFTVVFANPSPTQTACQIVFENAPPSGDFEYVAGSGRLDVPGYGTYSADPTLGTWSVDAIVGASYELPPGETVTLEFRLSTGCAAVSGVDQVEIRYVDCADPGAPLDVTDSLSVEVLPGAITVVKSPANPAGGVGDVVTWTLEVNSTGLGSIKNVVVRDTLGPGLEYVSSTPAGSAAGQTVSWDAGDIAALAEMAPDDTVTISLSARVVACSGLDNVLNAQFGCDGAVCADTETGFGDCGDPATSSVALIQRLPFLQFSAPTIRVPYCAATTTVTIPVTNSGDGAARSPVLCADLGSLAVTNVQGGATYSDGCFYLPDVAADSTFPLIFDVTFAGDWCSSMPSGAPLYTLEYTNDCGVLHRAQPQFGSIGASDAPSLTVSKTGPAIAAFGADVTYAITARYTGPTSCGSSTTGIVTVTDTIPDGFPVVATAGGTWTPGAGGTGGTVVWTFDPAVVSTATWNLVVHIPLECGYCYTERTNGVTAETTSCCGCLMTASASATTAITCDRLYTSDAEMSSTALERCGDAITVTDTHTFADDAGLDTIAFEDFVYSFLKENGLVYVAGSASATIDGTPTAVTVTDGAGETTFAVGDASSVRGRTLVFTYDIRATSASAPACGSSASFYVWMSHEIPEVGPCQTFYDTVQLTVEPPAMAVSISGVPTIQEDCATYPVTITFRRTSALADPYDARLVLTGTSRVIADFAGATWIGVTPAEAPIVGADSVEWRFADGFTAPGATATITVPVTAKCGGPLVALGATGRFDDLCNDIGGYNDTCSTSASAASSLRLSGDVHISKTPEVIYTTQRTVTWQIEIYNSSNGTAYNVYVDDILGSGLVYASSSATGYSGAFSVQANRDHTGSVINGASFLFEKVAPGERPVITLTANLVACNNMTNTATVGWGCGGTACQTPRSDSSYVLVAPANVVATSAAPTPLDACATAKASVTFRSAGIAVAYNLTATATLPAGLAYAGNPEYRVSDGAWLPAGAPSGVPGPTLTWTSADIAALGAVSPGVRIEIRFDVQATCSFTGGTLQARSGYQNPCGQSFLSGIGSFSIAARTPSLSLTTTQTSPSAGQPVACGGNVTWEIRVTNNGPAAASSIWVEETLGSGLSYVSSTGGADGGSGSGQSATWEIVNLGVGSTAVLTVTAEATSCGALTSSIRAYWACGPDGNSATTPDCLSSSSATASATATRAVSVAATASMSPSSIGACETQKTIAISLSNASVSAPAYNPDVRLTLPAGLTYRPGTTEVNCGGGFAPASDPAQAGQVLTWYSLTSTGSGNDLCSLIPAGGSVDVRFQVDASCYRTTSTATLDLYYYDCCGSPQYHVTTTPSLTAAAPTLSVTMTPSSTALDCANAASTVTWTIAVTNTGSATAGFVRIIDTLGADLVRVSGGTQIGANPQQWGWEFGPLAPGGSQSVQIVVRLAAPPNDCTASRRTSTAVTSWGCTLAALDGDPNTATEYSCTSSGGSVTRTATVTVPDLSVSASDISPQFTCASDGISNGRVALTVRNTGTAAITTDFSITYSESTTGWSGGGTFTSLGGTLPLAAGGSRTLTLSNWPIACSSCSYAFTVSLDTGAAICECRENNNTATLAYTPASPDLTVASSTLAPTCAGDGQVRVQGNVTLRNQGCGTSPFTTNVPMRFTVYAGASCSGTVLDQWTQTFTGVSLAAGGGTQAFAVDRTATYNSCSPCEISILIEADYSNAICECSGANNALCAGPLTISFPDLIVSAIDFSGVGCANDAMAGFVAVTVTNQGCGSADAFNVGLSTSGCLTFATQRVTSLAGGSSVVVQFPVATTWSGCGTCGCTFTATVDAGSEVCECDGANNTGTATYTSPLPDLVIATLTASATSPCQPGSASVTVRNAGCGVAPSGVIVGVTGAVTGQAATSVALAAGESQTVTVPFDTPVGCGSGYAVTATVDPLFAVCECNGANNASATMFSVSSPDLAVTDLAADCNLDDTFTVTANVRNVGGQPAADVSIRVVADDALVHEEAVTLAAGAVHALSYVTPPLLCAVPHTIRVVADEADAICECSEANNEAATSAALCACPALSTAKSIASLWRRGASISPATPVEPGDIIEYVATVTNHGGATAFRVDLADALPAGLAYHIAAPGHDGQYSLSAGGSGTFSVPAGSSTFTTSLDATLSSGSSLTLRYCAIAASSLHEGAILTNVAEAVGEEGNGTPIPAGGASATTSGRRPALRVDKAVTDIVRDGSSRGSAGPVEPGDVVAYRVTIENVGGGTAYSVVLEDALPAGLVYHSSGTWVVSSPAATGSLGAPVGGTSLSAAISAPVAGGATLTASYTALATSSISGVAPLLNTAEAAGEDGAGNPIPETEASTSDTFSDSAVASVGSAKPALSVDKVVVDVRRGGSSAGAIDPVLYDDVVVYRVVVRNAGTGTAYGVRVDDALPSGFVVDTTAPCGSGTYSVDSPSSSGSLGLAGGASSFSFAPGVTVAAGGRLTLEFAARATSGAQPGVWLTNTSVASGRDGSGSAIPASNAVLGDTSDDDVEDADADDTGVAAVRVGVPALVTEKEVARVVRGELEVATTTVEAGDVVTYSLVVRNVGQGPAYDVGVTDVLPASFTYAGPTSASWASGSSSLDPSGTPGPSLAWPLGAMLEPGGELRVTFSAQVSGVVTQGESYVNEMTASGRDAAGVAISPDASVLVPADDDADDTSEASVLGVVPALVTRKRVLDVARDGSSVGMTSPIVAGDVVTFELEVTNVGLGNAYNIDVRDDLPPPLRYVLGTTTGSWTSRSSGYRLDPSGAPGPALTWWTHADLPPGGRLTLRFAARVDSATSPNEPYTDILYAWGLDGSGRPIPPAGDVPADTDSDDQDAATVLGGTAPAGAPALVTEKGILRLTRAGERVTDDRVEQGDVVTYEIRVENVGPATAHRVDLSDSLPPEFAYVSGSALATTPDGVARVEPETPGDELLFALGATLERGEDAVVRFDALVVGPLVDERSYVNRMRATGTDRLGIPIPPDQRATVPADRDADDASSASVRARSWLTEGSGGLVSVPILRKTATTLGAGGCAATAAVMDRVWFQTDVAMLAASEFASYAASPAGGDLFPDTLLPTWARTTRADLARYAVGNLLQVDVLSSVGIRFADAPRVLDAAAERGIPAEQAVAERLAELARLSGATEDDLVPAGDWIYLESEAGEPVFSSERDTAWGKSGAWTFVDEDLVGSSLGMGLVRQAQAARSLVGSDDPAERYTGWVIAELMANKLLALDRALTVRPAAAPSYVPHASRRLDESSAFEVVDGTSVLFDQASLLWGSARVLAFLSDRAGAWPESERGLASTLEEGARTLLARAAESIAAYHVAADGRLLGRSDVEARADASTVEIGILLVAAREAMPHSTGGLAETLTGIQTRAAEVLLARQAASGRFAEVAPTAGLSSDLAAQFAGIYGLLAVREGEAAQRTFDFLEREAWDDWEGFGLYRMPEDAAAGACYSALDMGLGVGALRELAGATTAERRAAIERRLAAFVRSVLDDAALELDNAGRAGAREAIAGDGRTAILGITAGESEILAPVLARSLCLRPTASEAACGGLRVLPHDPWYQTDIAMYAAYVLQAAGAGREDDADANLIAVDFHSTLGVPFVAYPELAALAAGADPIAVPFYSGDPYLGEEATTDLAWNASTFDARVVPSAVGMTLLREAQEVVERAGSSSGSPEDETTLRRLAASTEKKIDVLEQLVQRGPGGLPYIPHAFAASAEPDGVRMDVVDPTSDLFDQASLLLGLAETIALLHDPAAAAWVAGSASDVAARAEALVSIVLGTLETAHAGLSAAVLADVATPDGARWAPGADVTTMRLGLLAEALEEVLGTFGPDSALGARARALMDMEAAFLRSALWDGSGGYRETWTASGDPSEASCAAPTVAGQLAALRTLLAADRVSGGAQDDIRAAFLAFETRFWDDRAEMYVGQLDRLAWCMTPLDLALVVGVLAQAGEYVGPAAAGAIASHVVRHVDRALDAADLQIPARSLDAEARPAVYAPVLDRRVCLEPPAPYAGLSWTRPGDLIRYEVEVENPTEGAFTQLALDDLLPEGVELLGATPVGAVDGRSLRWTFDRLEPGAVMAWQIDVRVTDAALGDALVNCATLTYTDEAGLARPTREACASVTLQTADDARAAGLRASDVAYRTDEAMRLASALERAADLALLGSSEDAAREASRANLGVLLGESGLGMAFSLAPIRDAGDTAAALRSLAQAAGLPGLPDLAAPIFLPTSGGVPLLERGAGFVERSQEVTPAALGWTLAREAQFLAQVDRSDAWSRYLRGFVALAVEAQLAWLDEASGLASAGSRMPHGVTATAADGRAIYAVSDSRSLAYDQASLLLGLAGVAASRGASTESARAAARLAEPVFADLARHVSADGIVSAEVGATEPASWSDAAVVARSLGEAAASLPQLERQAESLLAAMGRAAWDGVGATPREEAGRIATLLLVGRFLGDRATRDAGLVAWRSFASTSVDRDGDIVFATAALLGWRYTPAELALAFELLEEVAQADVALRLHTESVAAALVRGPVLAERVQLWTPSGYWSDHVGLPCSDAAPVFAVRSGPLALDPLWALRP